MDPANIDQNRIMGTQAPHCLTAHFHHEDNRYHHSCRVCAQGYALTEWPASAGLSSDARTCVENEKCLFEWRPLTDGNINNSGCTLCDVANGWYSSVNREESYPQPSYTCLKYECTLPKKMFGGYCKIPIPPCDSNCETCTHDGCAKC